MGIVNVTPDSFSDGGRVARRRARRSRTARSSPPRARRSSTSAASRRARAPSRSPPTRSCAASSRSSRACAARAGAVLSIDTTKLAVAARGARGRRRRTSTTSPRCATTRRSRRSSPSAGADCCLMHMQGEPRTMQDDPRYDDVVDDVRAFLEERAAFAIARGRRPRSASRSIPGIGFGKTLEHNLELLRRLDEIAGARLPRRHRRLAQVVPRRADRPRGRRGPRGGDRRRQRPRARARRAASSASTTSRRRSTPWRWRLLRCRGDDA